MNNIIYIINLGDYFSRLTARKIRSLTTEVRPKIVNFNTPIKEMRYAAGFIFSGSPYDSDRVPKKIINPQIFITGLPVMGICLGAQLMALFFHGKIGNYKKMEEYGIVDLHIMKNGKLFRGAGRREKVLMIHRDSIINPGENFVVTARTDRCPIAAIRHKNNPFFGLQFHPELSPCGGRIFANFISLTPNNKKQNQI